MYDTNAKGPSAVVDGEGVSGITAMSEKTLFFFFHHVQYIRDNKNSVCIVSQNHETLKIVSVGRVRNFDLYTAEPYTYIIMSADMNVSETGKLLTHMRGVRRYYYCLTCFVFTFILIPDAWNDLITQDE